MAGQSNGKGSLVGVVKWFNSEKGYGFITPEGGGKDVFLHANALRNSDIDDPEPGDRLCFDTEEGRKGVQATNISAA